MTRTALALICLGGFLNCGTNTAGGDRRISNGPSAADSDAGAAAADDAGPVADSRFNPHFPIAFE